jgi:hypothetical protein
VAHWCSARGCRRVVDGGRLLQIAPSDASCVAFLLLWLPLIFLRTFFHMKKFAFVINFIYLS